MTFPATGSQPIAAMDHIHAARRALRVRFTLSYVRNPSTPCWLDPLLTAPAFQRALSCRNSRLVSAVAPRSGRRACQRRVEEAGREVILSRFIRTPAGAASVVYLILVACFGCTAPSHKGRPERSVSIREDLDVSYNATFSELCAWATGRQINSLRSGPWDLFAVSKLNGDARPMVPCGGWCERALRSETVRSVTVDVYERPGRGYANPTGNPSSLAARLPRGGRWRFSAIDTQCAAAEHAGLVGELSPGGPICVSFAAEDRDDARQMVLEDGISWHQFSSFRAQVTYVLLESSGVPVFRYISVARELPARAGLRPPPLEFCPGELDGQADMAFEEALVAMGGQQ